MNSKKLLRFYFGADVLNAAIDNLILAEGCLSGRTVGRGENDAARLCVLVGEKAELCGLWKYLDGVMGGIGANERAALRLYAGMRCGLSRLDGDARREIRAAVMKFRRHARRLDRWGRAVGLVDKYYALTFGG